MAKAGMKRPSPRDGDRKQNLPKNDVPPVPELQGKAKHSDKKARPIGDID